MLLMLLGLTLSILQAVIPVIVIVAAVLLTVGIVRLVIRTIFRCGWSIFKGSLIISGVLLRSLAGPFIVAAVIVGLLVLIF